MLLFTEPFTGVHAIISSYLTLFPVRLITSVSRSTVVLLLVLQSAPVQVDMRWQRICNGMHVVAYNN